MSLGVNTIQGRDQHLFSRVAKSDATHYSTFDTSHSLLTSFSSGDLIPFYCEEVLPGEYRRLRSRHMVRLSSPAITPFMQNLYFCYEFFYVKNRYVYDRFKNLMGEQRNPNDSVDFPIPMLDSGSEGVAVGSIFDYMGIPVNVPNLKFSALPFRCYNLIFNEWYRDQNLQEWLNVGGTGVVGQPSKDEFGEKDQLSNYLIQKRNKKHDYFTSALPWQQKGDATVLSLASIAPVVGNGNALGLVDAPSGNNPFYVATGKQNTYLSAINSSTPPDLEDLPVYKDSDAVSNKGRYLGVSTNANFSGLEADLRRASGFSISDIRTAFQIQAIKELDARGGTRYNEKIYNEFGVRIADAELSRPEYLCGKSIPFYTTPITQTSGTSSTQETPQGNLSAVSYAFSDTNIDFVKGFDDHGWIIGLCSVRTDTQYQQGLHRKFSRRNRFDFFSPLLERISEQPILKKELLAQGNSVVNEEGKPVDDETFGYQEAWAEYKYGTNFVTGLMRSNSKNPDDSLDAWHLALNLTPDALNLNSDFIKENIPLERVMSVPGTAEKPLPQFILNSWFDEKCTKPMAVYSVPSYLGGRF